MSSERVEITRPCDTHGEPTANGIVLGAGVLPITFSNDGELCFLLGREHFEPGWHASEAWSAFEGGRKNTDRSLFHTAAREYVEESLSILEGDVCSLDQIAAIEKNLSDGGYLIRITLQITNHNFKRKPRYHVTFVRLCQWEPCKGSRFLDHRSRLMACNVSEHSGGPNFRWQNHAGVGIQMSKEGGKQHFARNDYLEKSHVQLWPISDIITAMQSGRERFRPCFMRTARIVAELLMRPEVSETKHWFVMPTNGSTNDNESKQGYYGSNF